MRSIFDACILTNGRSSYDLCMRSLKEQSIGINIHVIKNMSMVDAMNHIYKCDYISKYFLKVDDDFIFHPRAIEFLQKFVPFEPYVVMKYWHLYDVATKSIIQSVKIYDRNLIEKVGGFRARSSGRVDPSFLEDCRTAKLKYVKDTSVIAIHACSTEEDQEKYEKIWSKNSPSGMHIKNNKKAMLECKISMKDQYDNKEKWVNNSNSLNSSFYKFLRKK